MKIAFLIPFLFFAGCAPTSATSPIELCKKTVMKYGTLRDQGPAELYAGLFTDDGEFHLGPNVTKGRHALMARHKASNAETVWRHIMIDSDIYYMKEGYRGSTSFHIFAGPKGDKPGAHTREILGDYIDEFVIENDKCKIKSRKVNIVFDTSN